MQCMEVLVPVQWNLCIMDILGPTKCPDYQGVLIFQVSLYDKASFGTITKCVDYYAGVIKYHNSLHERGSGHITETSNISTDRYFVAVTKDSLYSNY